MKTAANPAVTSSEAGISPSSSRLRALIWAPCQGPSSLQLPQLEIADQARRVLLRAEVVVQERFAAIGGHERGGHSGYVEGLVKADAGRELVGKAAEDGHDALLIGAQKVELPAGEISAGADQEEHDHDCQQSGDRFGEAPLPARRGARGSPLRAGQTRARCPTLVP